MDSQDSNTGEGRRPTEVQARSRLSFFESADPFLRRWILAQILGPPVVYKMARVLGGGRGEVGRRRPAER